MKKAIGYIRVSTKGQDSDDKFGKEAQKEMIEKYAKDNDYEIIEYLEDTISGVKEERPQFDKILNEYNDIDVIVAKTDRISRDTKLYYYYVMLLEKRNIKLVSVQENFEEFGEFSSIIKSFVLFVSEQERRNIARRTSGGRKVKANNGGYSGGKAPYGYKVQDKQLVINESESKNVILIYELRQKGYSMGKIADYLNANDIPTRSNSKWQMCTIKSILDNEDFYKGYYQYGDCRKVVGRHEPIFQL